MDAVKRTWAEMDDPRGLRAAFVSGTLHLRTDTVEAGLG
jgi:hypothetical protein